MNSEWHQEHVLPRGASLEERIAWHREHQKRCACRPIPPKLKQQMARPSRNGGRAAIDGYLAGMAPTNRALLEVLRKTIRAVVPEAEECISYRIPAFRFQGRIIAGFSGTSKGCSYYPFSGTTLKTLAGDIAGYSQTKSALHFGPDRPLPKSLVRKLLKSRIAENHPRAHRRDARVTTNMKQP
jgi:uncharacterized protein YdhG (YjbR/CyaY superfamily)